MKKKIMFFLNTLSGGGAERTVINIINNINKKEFDVVLVLGSNKNNDYIDLLPPNIDIRILNIKNFKLSVGKLVTTIFRVKPDMIFSTLNHNNIMILLAKFLTFKNIPTVVREANNRTQSGSVTKINRWLTNFFYNKFATKVIALSEGVKKDLVDNFSIYGNKITVIYNPVEISLINKSKYELIDDYIKKEEERTIISVGRLVTQKDYPTLLKAFSTVTKIINAKLIILGKGPLKEELMSMCRALEIEDKVEFMGFKKNPYKYIKESDVFVLSSKWEGFGHVIVEAMVTGTPVISTNCNSGPSEILGDNKYGQLVPVEDHETLAKKILQLLKDEELRERYIELGYKRAEDFNAKNIVKQYEAVFNEVFH